MWDLNNVSLGQEFVRGVQGDWRREAPAQLEHMAERTAHSSLTNRVRLAIAERLIYYGTRLKTHAAPVQTNH